MFEQLQLPLHRSTKEKDAVEQLMDMIAGDIGFFEPLFAPVLEANVAQEGRLTFSVVENVRQEFAPSASLEATLNACANRTETPVVLVQAEMAPRKSDERAIRSGQKDLFGFDAPKPDLRAVQVSANAANPSTSRRTCVCRPPRYLPGVRGERRTYPTDEHRRPFLVVYAQRRVATTDGLTG